MSDWSSWGSSWLGSWGNSWGPLHEVYDPYDPLKDPLAQGRAGKKPEKDYAAENLRRQFEQQQKALQEKEAKEYNQKRLQLDDMLATEFIMALVQTELLDGTI